MRKFLFVAMLAMLASGFSASESEASCFRGRLRCFAHRAVHRVVHRVHCHHHHWFGLHRYHCPPAKKVK